MGPPTEHGSRCNEKLSSVIKSTSLSLLLTTLIFLSVSPAPAPEPRRCYWCGPLAEQVHRSRRAKPCSAPLQETVCEEPYRYCAVVAVKSPQTESRLCVKRYSDECYPLYCNTTRSYKITCPCRGDLCNGPNTPREEAAFELLQVLTASRKEKRSIEHILNRTESPLPQSDNTKDNFSTTDRNRPDYQEYFENNRRNTNHETIDMTTTFNAWVRAENKEEDSSKTHDTIVNDSEVETENRVDDTQKVQTAAESKHGEISTRLTVDSTSQTEHVVTQTFKTIIDDITTLTTEHNEIITKYDEMTTTVHGQSINEISTLEDPSKSTANMAVTSDNPFDRKITDLNNEISNDLASTEVTNNKNLNANTTVDNEVTGISKPKEVINDSKKPGDNIIDPGNEVNPNAENKKSTENSVSDLSLSTERANVNSEESNEVRKPGASEPSPSDIGITKSPQKDTNDIDSHGIEILNQKIETTTVDSNSNDTCNAGTCNASAASNEGDQNKATPPATTADVTTQKNIMHNEEIETKSTKDNDKNTAIVTMSNVSNKDELADSVTTVSTTLQSKLGPTTELTTLATKSTNKTKGKNNGAFSLSGCILLIVNAYLLSISL